MSSQEFKLRKLLEDATFFIKNAEEDETFIEKCKECMDQADLIIRQNTRESFLDLSAEVIVMFTEVALLTNRRDHDAQRVLDIFFQRFTQEDQFFCRALLAMATVEERKIKEIGLKGEDNLKQVLHSFSFIRRAIEIATKPENKVKYQFVVYNASIKTWHILRPLMKPQWAKNLVEFIEKISNLLEEADDSDFNWRCRYLNALVKAMFDAERKVDALKILDKLWDLTKKKGECKFQETLFRNRVHLYRDNNGVLGNIKKETETGEDKNAFKPLLVIQSIKSGILPEAQIEKELTAIMAALSPSSINNDPAAAQASTKITPLFQDRLAECGRLAIKYNLIQLCEGACNVIARARQGSLRAKVWTEYSKAELLLKKPTQDIDKKTGMKLNTFQKQIEDFERRVEALKILDRAMISNKRLQDADIIIEGCILIWNIGLPLLKKSTRSHIYKPFQSAAQALEQIQSNDNILRVCLHLELAKYEIEQDFLSKATLQLQKALNIDYSLTLKQIPADLKEDDDPGDFQRPYQKVLKFMLKKLSLKTNLYGGDPDNIQDQIILDVENAKTTKNTKMRETLLDKALKELQDFDEPDFEVDPDSNLVEEEIKQAQRKFHLAKVRSRKERVLISAEIAKLALEEMLIDVAFNAATLAVANEWEPQKNTDLIIAQSEANFILAQCYVEYLLEEDIEIGYKELVTVEEDQDERDFTNEDRTKFQNWKVLFTKHIIQGVKLGQQAQQSWLVFNGGIEFWNSYLPIFKKPNFFELILSEGVPALIECFEGMNNCFINASFNSENVDYELDKKMQVFSNLSMMLARLYEYLGKNDEAVRVCDVLLQKQLPSHLRKTFDSIKARVTKNVSNLGAIGQQKGGAQAKGAKDAVQQNQYQPSKTEIITSEVLSYLELIQNGNKDLIQKAMDSLNLWSPNQSEEIELELNAELWCRLGRLSINVNTNPMIKIGLYSAEMALKNGDDKAKNKQYGQIPVTRLRWYSVAESLYGEALFKLLDTQKQEKESQDKLLHTAVSHFVESCNIAAKATIGYLVLESAKSMWNALLPLLDAPNNRKQLVKPLSLVHTHLKSVQENNDPDFLVLLYSALFTCIQEQKDWKLGETITEEAFLYMPQTHQKVLWEAKMLFLSKLGKNVLNAISNMKENNASLMAKVWVKLARSSSNELEQHSAYNKAIEILRKEESVEVVEVLIEYAEWLQRHKYTSQDVEDQLLLAVDLLMDIEPGWDDEDDEAPDEGNEDEQKTRKTRQSKSSKVSKQSMAKTKASRANKSAIKSKFGGQSKKSRASKRSAAMRSKAGSRQSKKTTTALSKRQEEDSQPLFLNCSHFEKLIRIHSMLATIAPDSYKQREYALDAHFFLMKMWEQTYQTLNAQTFFEEHKTEVEELGFQQSNQESRRQYFYEIFTNNEIGIPVKFILPEKPEDWVNFTIPESLVNKSKGHEDKLMIAKWTFIKPELTLYHLQNIASILEEHYFSIQLLPVLEVIKFFSKVVFEDRKLEEIQTLKKARLLMNIGLKQEGEALKQQWDNDHYRLNDEEKKLNQEKIKSLRDPTDNLKDKFVAFHFEDDLEPHVLEQLKIHEIWILYADELLKWGEYIQAKDFILETYLHARILKDQDNYAWSLMMLSTIAFLEGESAQALRCDMQCHVYVKGMRLVENAIEHTFNLLLTYNKIDDCLALINPSLAMLENIYDKQLKMVTQTQSQNVARALSQNNLPLDFALGTIYILKAILSLKESQATKNLDDSERKMEESFSYIEKYEILMQKSGYKQEHLIKLLKYSQILQQDFGKEVEAELKQIELIKQKLERSAKILLRVQELLTNQVYYIGLSQDSSQQRISLPLVRLLGITKLRIAQVNTSIGVVKNSIKLSSTTSGDNEKKLEKVIATFMDAVTKQIEAQTNTYKQKMNRYEKSISILYSALNLIHPVCPEYAEALVEIARNRRLLAVNKKHLRGQWRQDAIEVDRVNLKQLQIEEEKDRKDQLEEKGLEGEVKDVFIDYKEEALKTFVDLLEGRQDVLGDNKSTFQKLLDKIGDSVSENVLATFSLEYTECRANLNKEQAFFYLALYQYAISRSHLLKTYLNAAPEKHPDVLRLRQLNSIKESFSSYTSPFLPKAYQKTEEDLREQSKPYKIITSFYPIEDFKENLPSHSAYLVVQLSEDKQQLYYSIMQVTKERKFNYFTSKITLSDFMREKLFQMVDQISQNKLAMQKTPITIEEDLINLEKDAEEEISKIIRDLNTFFEPMIASLNDFINPVLKTEEEENNLQSQQQMVGGKGAAGQKGAQAKQAPAKPAPSKPGGKAAAGELAAYESNLPLPTSGIESLILLIDHRIESLPFETLSAFSKVPVIARDFNLHFYMQRLKTIGHQAPIHNNQGIQKENLRFIIDAPQPLEEKSQQFVAQELPKLLANSKWDGLLTKQHHIPSEGEWQRLISNASLFAYYSMTSIVHKFPPALISDLSIFSKCKALIIIDRMNTFKTLIDRGVLTSQHYVPNQQPFQQVAMFSLCGISTVMTNLWAVKPEVNFEIFQNITKSACSEQIYLGAALRKYREEQVPSAFDRKNIYKWNTVVYGVPIIRIV